MQGSSRAVFRTAVVVCALSWLSGSAARAGEIGFAERFALAEDREKVLSELVPGTEDYYFYHALHYQNTGRLDEVDRLLKTWVERHGRTARVQDGARSPMTWKVFSGAWVTRIPGHCTGGANNGGISDC